MTTVTDPEIHRVQYAFDGAFQRMLSASDDEALMAELSNLLGQVYRLRELSRSRLGSIPAASSPDLRAAMAACWVRNLTRTGSSTSARRRTCSRTTTRLGTACWSGSRWRRCLR